jgi:hypothetical protein
MLGKMVIFKNLKRLEINLVKDPSFEIGNHNFKKSIGAFFHIVENRSRIQGNFVGRLAINTRSYLASGVTQSNIKQVISDQNVLNNLMAAKRMNGTKQIILSLSMYSQLESCYFTKDDFQWGASLVIEFHDGTTLKLIHSFDTSNRHWQGSLITACLSKWSQIKSIQIVAQMNAKSCVSLWDGIVLH